MIVVAQSIKMVYTAKLTNARTVTAKSPAPNITGLSAWYEAASLDSFKANEATDNGQITTWYDIAPESIPEKKNSLSKSASAAVTYVAKGINNLPSVKFDGTDKISASSFASGDSRQNTVFFVVRSSNLSSNAAVIDSGSGTSSTAIALANNGININSGNNVTSLANNCCAEGKDYIIATYLNGTHSRSYINNASRMTSDSPVNPGSNPLKGISIGVS